MVIQTILWLALPWVVFGLLLACLPSSGTVPRWRRVVSHWWERLRFRLPGRARRRRRAQVARDQDPFEVLALQMRLASVAAQLRALEDDPHTWALAARLAATQAAYDALLAEACLLAGIGSGPPPSGTELRRRSEPERLEDELALAEAGWFW
jgi:hypothetical protein